MKAKRFLALLLTLVMVLGMMPLTAFANEESCAHTNAYYSEPEKPESEPTCFEPAMGGFWFCEDCGQYLDKNKENGYWEPLPAAKIPATGHYFNTDTGVCDECGLANPVYTKVTSLDDVNEEDLYIIVAEVAGTEGTKYFVLGGLDERHPDEQSNVWCPTGVSNAIRVTANPDGSISLVNQETLEDGSPSEFMLDVNPEQFGDMSWLGLTTLMLKLPNHCVYPFQSYSYDNNGYMGVPRYTDEYGMWDSSEWIIDFYTTVVTDDTYRYEDEFGSKTHAEQVEDGNIDDNITEGNLLLYKASFYSVGGAMFTIRLREYNDQYYFICGEDWCLEGSNGWDYVTDTTPTNDVQYAVSLYRYDVPTVNTHTCDFGDWTDNGDGRTHTHTCNDPSCGKTETEPHRWDSGVETTAPKCTTDGIMTYTCVDCHATKTEDIPELGHLFGEWTENGENHTRSCGRDGCTASESNPHSFSNWSDDGDLSHSMGCTVCTATRTSEHNFGDGEVIQGPTHLAVGQIKYTCADCLYEKFVDMPIISDHEWSNWVDLDDVSHVRECICGERETEDHDFDDGEITKEPTEEEEGILTYTCEICGHKKSEAIDKETHIHDWSEWKENGNGAHSRYCNCGESETDDHEFDDGKVVSNPSHLNEGLKVYTCGVCNAVSEEILDKTPDHTFVDGRCACGEEDPNYVVPHEHSFVNGKCECGEEDPNYVAPHEHKFGDWICEATVVGKHYRECECGEREIGDCSWDNGKISLEPTYDAYGERTYTCTLCGGNKTESIDMLIKVEEIVSPDNDGVKVTVPEGSSAAIAEGTVIEVEQVEEEVSETVKENVSAAIGEDKAAEVLAEFDIDLVLNGVNVQPGDEIEVTLPIPENAAAYNDLQVVYIDDNGNVTPCETTVNDDGTVTFVTDHFSRYAIIGINKNGGTPVGAIVGIVIGAIVVLGIGSFAIFWFVVEKKSITDFIALVKNNTKNHSFEESEDKSNVDKNQEDTEETENS